MSIGYNPKIVMNGLVFCLDAANRKSYSGSGTTWSELKSKVTGTLTNGPTYSSTNNGAIVLDGVNDYVTFGSSFTTLDLTDKSLQCWIKKTGSGSGKGIIDKDFDNKIKHLTICILQQLYDNNLNQEHITKITNDITYIQKYKQYIDDSKLDFYIRQEMLKLNEKTFQELLMQKS